MVHTAIITSPICAHHCDYPSSHRQIIIVIMIIAMIIMLIQIVIVTIMPMIMGGTIILASVGEVAEIMRGRWAEGTGEVIGFDSPQDQFARFSFSSPENLVSSKRLCARSQVGGWHCLGNRHLTFSDQISFTVKIGFSATVCSLNAAN